MHLLAREETGLRCLLQVALEDRSGAPVPIAQIAAAEGISGVYAAKLLRQLRIAGLVESTRGAAGGYRLTRSAVEITVWDAIHALDESFLPASTCDCDPEDRVDCRRTTDCAVSSLWRRIGDEIRRELSGITLAELCRGSIERSDRIELPTIAKQRAAPMAGPVAARDPSLRAPRNSEIERTTTWPFSN